MKLIYLFILVLLFGSCYEPTHSTPSLRPIINTIQTQNNSNTIEDRYQPEKGYKREKAKDDFGKYLRKLKLKPSGSLVKYYDGETKPNEKIYSSVVDLPIGKKNLHQCADAIMRLRADFFYEKEKYKEIHFKLTNGFQVNYTKWMEGYRVKVVGNQTNWIKKGTPSNTKSDYKNYLEFIFTYAGTLSLSKELESITISEAQIGDVFIQGGSPGHAIIIVDQIINLDSGKKMFLLAQSYMPAQEIQILLNPKTNGSWYSFENEKIITTPEWNFSKNDLKRF